MRKPADVDVDGAGIDVGIVRPDRVEQALARKDPAGMFEKMPEQPELGRAEGHGLAVAADAMASDVHLDIGIDELLARQARAGPGAAPPPTRATSSRGLNGLVT